MNFSDIVKHTLAVEKINITETATKEIQSNFIKINYMYLDCCGS